MYQQLLLILTFFETILCQGTLVEYLNAGKEDLALTLVNETGTILLPINETYVVEFFSTDYSEEISALPMDCVLEPCTYPHSKVRLTMGPITDNINDTLSKYVIVPDGAYSRGFVIESLDQPNCSIATCEFNLVEDCPVDLQIINDDEIVACNISDVDMFGGFCPNFGQLLQDGDWDWFSCEASQQIRVTIK